MPRTPRRGLRSIRVGLRPGEPENLKVSALASLPIIFRSLVALPRVAQWERARRRLERMSPKDPAYDREALGVLNLRWNVLQSAIQNGINMEQSRGWAPSLAPRARAIARQGVPNATELAGIATKTTIRQWTALMRQTQREIDQLRRKLGMTPRAWKHRSGK